MREFLKNLAKGIAMAAAALAIFSAGLLTLIVFAATGFGVF